MFFKSNNNIYNFVYYNEKSNIILIEFCLHNLRKYFKIEDNFFRSTIVPLLKKDADIRTMIYFAIENRMASYVEPRDYDTFDSSNGNDMFDPDYMRVVK